MLRAGARVRERRHSSRSSSVSASPAGVSCAKHVSQKNDVIDGS
jgi:hypothetical protein